jgi:hypothetical protein
MQTELTPDEARGGVVSGRVVTVLVVSSLGAFAALSATWWFFFRQLGDEVGMPPHDGGDEAAGRHDAEAASARVRQSHLHQPGPDAAALVGRRHFGVSEDQRIALLAIDRDRHAVRRVELVLVLGRVVANPVRHQRSTSQNIG